MKLEFTEFEFGEQEKVVAYRKQTEQFLIALEKVSGIGGAFVSDRTMLCDFSLEPQELIDIGKELGIEVKEDEYLGDIVVKMFQKQSPAN